ncbi:uncharacterized protein At1g28695-like [Rutidosis leptorrhynchoides]|uniref:uncharacterized protein At1g28695-like n=1 Tax=Rutidosis leptorrhynchoides TaxID=125765 RepID=UPI003A9985E2
MAQASSSNNMVANGDQKDKPPSLSPEFNHRHLHPLNKTRKMVVIFVTVALACLFIFNSSIAFPFYSFYNAINAGDYRTNSISTDLQDNSTDLKSILKLAAMDTNTVIITSINKAWASPNGTFELLLESFRTGNQTERFLKHLVVVSLDENAYTRCLKLHPHCYNLKTPGLDFSEEAYFMAANYLKIVWEKINFLQRVLDLGYSFVFTDADIMWFRDPFLQFQKDVDIQISCDKFNGNPFDLRNLPNSGFMHVKASNKTIQFYKFWYDSRLTNSGHDQDVLNKIKLSPFVKDIGLQIRFLDTAYFGGFCQPSQDLNKVCTMHANCCVGLENKVHDLGVMLNDWQKYTKSLANQTTTNVYKESWTIPQFCRGSLDRPRPAAKKNDGLQQRKSSGHYNVGSVFAFIKTMNVKQVHDTVEMDLEYEEISVCQAWVNELNVNTDLDSVLFDDFLPDIFTISNHNVIVEDDNDAHELQFESINANEASGSGSINSPILNFAFDKYNGKLFCSNKSTIGGAHIDFVSQHESCESHVPISLMLQFIQVCKMGPLKWAEITEKQEEELSKFGRRNFQFTGR